MIKDYFAGRCDVAVIGAGHAGIEAALAAARLGLETLCFTVDLDAVGNMPCNPAVGGTGKGHLVRSWTPWGGEMARAADRACIQYRVLNRGKGPAVWSLRAQADRREYQKIMKRTLERQERLWVKQAEVVDVLTGEDGAVSGVRTATGAVYEARAVVVCTGTYLGGAHHRGRGPADLRPRRAGRRPPPGREPAAAGSGPPPVQDRHPAPGPPPQRGLLQNGAPGGGRGDAPLLLRDPGATRNRAVCYLTYTNEATHAVIRANLDRSPLFSGAIEGIGPRYCPSIEDKVVRFPDKPRHQLFIEPMGLDTGGALYPGLLLLPP